MPKRPTPIERAISGEPLDRRERYHQRLQQRGLTYVRIKVPVDQVERLRAFARELVTQADTSDASLASDHD